jgi:hypothetical protein
MPSSTASYSRRDFVRLGALGAPLLSSEKARACILIWQSGGLSHLDSFDPKPEAPREIRGEFRAIRTSVPGIRISEQLPRIARRMHKLTLLRSLCSEETNHERARWQLRPTPLLTPVSGPPPRLWHLGEAPLERGCRRACQEVAAGARLVVVNAPRLSFDTHEDNFVRLRELLLPEFDRAFAGLVDDLEGRGLLASTLVVATGEFGRSPRINARGGRDHHAGAWSAVLAGAGLPGGRVVGATDRYGEEVTESPVTPADLLRTIYAILGVGESQQHLARGRIIRQLFA